MVLSATNLPTPDGFGGFSIAGISFAEACMLASLFLTKLVIGRGRRDGFPDCSIECT